MKTNLKENIFIEGFDDFKNHLRSAVIYDKNIIYHGKTSEISEKLAKECIEFNESYGEYKTYMINPMTYKENNTFISFSVKESIQSACPEEYCIIYKTN